MRKFLLIGCLLAALVLTSCEQSTSGEIEAAPRVANPKADVSVTADVPVGTGVMLSTTTEGALIYYTLNDETVPTSGAERLYTEGKLVSLGNTEGEVTLRAIAVKPGWGNSDTEIWTYKVTSTAVPVPTVNLPGGTVLGGAKVSLIGTGETIRHTTDGRDPDSGANESLTATIGSEGSEAGDTVTLKTIAVKGSNTSAVRTVVYTIGTITWKAKAGAVNESGNTTGIKFTFSEAISDLTADHITLISEDGEVTKGKVFGSEKEWGLDLDEVKTPGNVNVRIRKAGVVSESEDGVVTVERKAGWTAKVANNEGSGSSTSINFNFDKPVTEFTAGNIKMTGSGSFKINQLSTSEDHKEWILSITVTKSGELYLSISGIYGFEDGNEIGPLIVKGDDPPGPVSDLTVVQTKTSDTEITLTWTNPTDADFDHVNISWIATSEPDAEPKQAGEVKGTSYTAEDLKPDTQYKFTVKAVDKAGNESDENSTTAITLSSPAAGVTIDIKDFKEGEFTLIGIDKDEILYWMDNKELTVRVDGLPDTGWTYEWALDNIIIKDANSNTLNWNSSWFSTSNEGIEHTFTVIATDSNNVPYSKSVTFKVVLSKGGGGGQ